MEPRRQRFQTVREWKVTLRAYSDPSAIGRVLIVCRFVFNNKVPFMYSYWSTYGRVGCLRVTVVFPTRDSGGGWNSSS